MCDNLMDSFSALASREPGLDDRSFKCQEDLVLVFDWTVTWEVRLNPAKCEALNLSNKRSPLQFTCTIGGGSILWKSLVWYLGVYINSKLTWSDHYKVTASRAFRILNVLR